MLEFEHNGSTTTIYDQDAFPLLMPTWGYALSGLTLFVIGFFGFFLNLLVIVLMFKERQLWTPLNIILFNLVCSDFSVSVLGNPFTLTSALYHRWIFGETMCIIYGFFMALLGIASITTLTVLSFERYLIVSRPTNPSSLTSRGAFVVILFIWIYALALTTPPLYGWGKYVSEAADISCSVNWEDQNENTMTYILFLFMFGQIIPCFVIGFSYINIIRTMKRNSMRMGQVNKAESRVTAMVFVMIIAFMVAWTPYSILALMEQFAPHGMVSPGVGVIPALIAKSSICYNPLIYVGMNSQYRASIKRLLGADNPIEERNTMISQTREVTTGNEGKPKTNFTVNISTKTRMDNDAKIKRNPNTVEATETVIEKSNERVILKDDENTDDNDITKFIDSSEGRIDETKRKCYENISLSVHTLDENDRVKSITNTRVLV